MSASFILRFPTLMIVILQPHFPYLKRKSFIEIWGRNQDTNERDQVAIVMIYYISIKRP